MSDDPMKRLQRKMAQLDKLERTTLETQAAEIARLRAWRDAINDALTNWLNPILDDEAPKDALRRLIGYEQAIERLNALDPTLSPDAAALIATARREGMQEAAQIAEGEVYSERYRTWPWWKNKDGSQGNIGNDSYWVKHCDNIAAAIRAAAGEGK